MLGRMYVSDERPEDVPGDPGIGIRIKLRARPEAPYASPLNDIESSDGAPHPVWHLSRL